MDVLTHIRSHRARLIGSRTPAEYFQGDSALALCCPLLPDYGLMDTVAGNHLITANATPYGPENISSEGAYFNGTTHQLRTTNNLNLSNKNKITIYASVKWKTYYASGSTARFLISLSNNTDGVSGAFGIAQHPNEVGYTLDDPILFYTRSTTAVFNLATWSKYQTRADKLQNIDIAGTIDRTLSVNEVNMAFNGQFLTPQNRRFNSNTVGNFANQPLYLCGPVTGFNVYTHCSMKNLAIRTVIDDEKTIADYYAWLNDESYPHFFSLFYAGFGSNAHKIRRPA